ncbi:dihydrodipicolinate synthase family protein [Nitratireductor sp. ZSWI3]|uniref:dihydrodipicolinate synthase family protein n=1 Tax=Nitratireductor sp. ZSWI3 TaxID=2966359 RepID=UPI00214F97DF|nr:dihydrodipicolinate synthase family protein [Nitratireductor sp. ZSWI3]MCR4265831.1 dihydrodipicolinate synthase family protein [Nitratireductor sp. ZSWI3]
MKTTPITFEDLASSVIGVPPLPRDRDLGLAKNETRRLVRHLESGGITSLMFGGNANFYHLPISEYADTVDFLVETAAPNSWVLPAIGPDFGKMRDQANILAERKFPAAMLLPSAAMFTPDGVAAAIRKFVERSGLKAVLYLKAENFLTPELIRSLVEDSLVASIKYAVVRPDPERDDYLAELCDTIDRRYLVSGIGERPVVVHFRKFGLFSFTSGSCSVAPSLCEQLRRKLVAGDFSGAERLVEYFMPLEDERDRIHPARVLHDAVTASGVADCGPQVPMFSNVFGPDLDAVAAAATGLYTHEQAVRKNVQAALAS